MYGHVRSMSIYVYLLGEIQHQLRLNHKQKGHILSYIVQQQETTVGGGWLQENKKNTTEIYNRNQLNTVITHETS